MPHFYSHLIQAICTVVASVGFAIMSVQAKHSGKNRDYLSNLSVAFGFVLTALYMFWKSFWPPIAGSFSEKLMDGVSLLGLIFVIFGVGQLFIGIRKKAEIH